MLDIELARTQEGKERSWMKLISVLKKQSEHWIMEQFEEQGYHDMKIMYMPLLMNIYAEGITNNELAKRARVTKQAMSKIVKELIDLGFIDSRQDTIDKRSSIITLTTKGKKLVINARQRVAAKEAEYAKLVGEKKFEDLKEILINIIQYNDQTCGKGGCVID